MKENGKERYCADCTKWQPGNTWGTGEAKNGFLVGSLGVCCRFPKKRKPCWNYKIACKHFEKEPRKGFVYSGQGPVTTEDLKNIGELIDEMTNENN